MNHVGPEARVTRWDKIHSILFEIQEKVLALEKATDKTATELEATPGGAAQLDFAGRCLDSPSN